MDDAVRQLIIGVSLYIGTAALMLLLALSAQTILRFSDSRLEKLAANKKAAKITRLQENSDLLRFRVQTVQFFCGSLIVYLLLKLLEPVYDIFWKLNGNVFTNTAVTETWVSCLLLWVILMALYCVLCTELPRRAAKTGRLSGERGERFALGSVVYLQLMLGLFKPLTLTAELFLKAFGRAFGVKPEVTDETSEDLIQLIDAQGENGGIEEDQAEMISNIFEFADLELREVMTHRTEICAAEIGAKVAEVVEMAVGTGFSRIPVYRDSIDDICGVIYIKDLLPLIPAQGAGEIPVAKYLHKIKYVPESGSCGELFSYFTEHKRQIAVVLDEYGGTAGIVTMEDLLESIVGNIRDEYDEKEEEEIQEITPHTFDILGSADPDEAMERLGRSLDEEHDYDTIGGFVTDLLGYIPEEGQTPAVRWKGITFGVISAKDNHIVKIRAVIDKEDVKDDDEKKDNEKE